MNRVYCAHNKIISSLGDSTAKNYAGIESYTTKSTKYDGHTPVCTIDRTSLDVAGLERFTFAEQLSIISLSDVISQSGVKLDNARTLLIVSTTKGNVECIDQDIESCYLWSISNKLASYFDCYHSPLIVSNACISGVASVVIASRLIAQGEYDHIYVLGIDVASEFIVSGFNSFKSISPTLCKPYDKSRDGLTLGEACGVILLTNNRELSPYKIVVTGGALSNDANHISGPSRTGDGLHIAIDMAMRQSALAVEDIGFVNMHGTATAYNDEMESKALQLASLCRVPCNSLKPYLGHTLGASGIIEIILSLEQLYRNHVFGVKGYSENGVSYELNISSQHRDMSLVHCLKTASGFGGTNAAVILSKEEHVHSISKKTTPPPIAEVSQVQISASSEMNFAEHIRQEYKSLADANLKFFKMDDLSKLAYVTSCRLLKNTELPYPKKRIGIVMANRSSSLNTDMAHQQIVNKHLPEGASPAVFVYTLANVAPAEIAIKHKLQGELSVFVSETKNMNFLYDYAQKLIEWDVCDAVIYGWCELLKENYHSEMKLIIRK